METIRIPNDATYSPIALTDVAIAAPLLSRLLLGATLPGLALQTAAVAVYAGSAIQDWTIRLGIRRIDFLREFGADLRHLRAMAPDVRRGEMQALAKRLNDGYTDERGALADVARSVDGHLVDYIAGITQQRIETSTEIREFSLVRYIMPFALGAADIFSGDVAIFHDTGVFQPHIVAHELAHRKGYLRELEAQALAYLALAASGEPAFVQSALCERLHRDVRALAGDDEDRFDREVRALGLRTELETALLGLRPALDPLGRSVADVMRTLYDMRMRITGQNGLSDYDVGFTNFLYTFETSPSARQTPPVAGRIHSA
jgi:hypothetical protein